MYPPKYLLYSFLAYSLLTLIFYFLPHIMDIFIKIVQFVLSLSILVLFHEFGHFLFAKLFKTRVEKFYMFFNPWFSLFKFKKGETEYGVGWLPLGGYVKIAGMIDESMDTEQMKQPAQPWEFRAKPAWQRLLIMLGGVLVNVLLAFVIYIGILFTWGETYLPAKNVTYGVVCDSVFKNIGMRNGDIIVALDNKEVVRFDDVLPEILFNRSKTIQVLRNGEQVSLDIPDDFIATLLELSSKSFKLNPLLTPRIPVDGIEIQDFGDYSVAYDAGMRKGDKILSVNGHTFRFYDEFSDLLAANKGKRVETTVLRGADTLSYAFALGEDGKFGFYPLLTANAYELATQKYTLAEAIPAGIEMGIGQLGSYVKQLKLLFSQGDTAYKSVGGMASIANIFPGYWNWHSFWELTALISIMLAVVNILPIPALDGGHVLFLLYEVVTRRKPGEKFMEYAQITGMIFIFGLFILANVNDIIKIFRVMKDQIEEFRAYRAKMNERILAADNKVIKRIYNIDTNTYMEGALSSKVKEMLGLATSMVLRCDDCIKYHLEKCYEQGVTTPELFEVFAVADVVGGTIVIPHLRRAVEYWELLQAQTGPEVENEK